MVDKCLFGGSAGGFKIRRLPFGSRIERNDLMGAIAPGNDRADFELGSWHKINIHVDFVLGTLLRKLHLKW